MPSSLCPSCGHDFTWIWDDAFNKFGFVDGANAYLTEQVVTVLEHASYTAKTGGWMLHNTVIDSIKRNGVELIPETATVGYDDPRDYLPDEIVKLLDAKLPEDGEAV